MANTQWKTVEVPRQLKPGETGSTLAVSFPSLLSAGAWKAAFRTGDTAASCMRTVAVQHTGGNDSWLTGNNVPSGSQNYPAAGVERITARYRWQLAPGNMPAVRVVALPSGMAQVFEPAIPVGSWAALGPQGRLDVDIDFDNGTDTDTKELSIDLPPSQLADGYESTDEGAAWDALTFGYVSLASADQEAPKLWSEDTTCTATIKHVGGTRIVHVSVCEQPNTHTVAHDAEDVSLHGWPAPQQPTARPQSEASDGATWEEHRFGTYRGLRVATKQNRTLGPAIASWSSYAESLAEVADTEQDPIAVTSTTWVGLSVGSSITEWSEDAPGHDIAGHYAGPSPENLSTRLDGATAIPVRCRVYARFTVDGGDFGYVKFQMSPRSWVIVPVPQVSTYAWYDITGWVESSDAADDTWPVLIDFARVEGGTMEVRDWCVHWGEFAVAA